MQNLNSQKQTDDQSGWRALCSSFGDANAFGEKELQLILRYFLNFMMVMKACRSTLKSACKGKCTK